jgi:O-antigen/teichoic acid export membrane protein
MSPVRLEMPEVASSPDHDTRAGNAAAERSNPIRNVIWNLARMGVTMSATVITSAIVARSLGPSNMGTYSYLLWITGVLVALCHFGLPTALTKFVAEALGRRSKTEARLVARRILVVQAGIAVGLTLVGQYLLSHTSQGSTTVATLAVLLVLPMAMQQALIGLITGAQAFSTLAICSTAGSTIQTMLILAAWWSGGTVERFMLALLTSNVVIALIYGAAAYVSVLKPEAEAMRDEPLNAAAIFRFAGPVTYLVLLDMVVWQRSEVFFLRRAALMQEIAFYSVAYIIANRLAEVLTSATSTLLPMQAHNAMRRENLAKLQTEALCTLQMFLLPICAIALILVKPATIALYGESYARVAQILPVLLFSLFAASFTDVGIATIYALNKQRSVLIPLSATAILNLGLAYILVPKWGAVGAALANSTAQVLEGFFLIAVSFHLLDAALPWSKLRRIYLAAAIAFAPASLLALKGAPATAIAAGVASGCALYVAVLFWQQEIEPSDWALLKAALNITRTSNAPIV